MPKPRKSRSYRSKIAANLTGPGSSASGARPSQMSANSMTINYTAMPTETLRFMLSRRHQNQTGPRRVLITRLQESDSPVGNEGLTIPLPSPAQRPKITSIDRWLDAFAIHSSVILYSYPSRGVDLISYQ